MFFVISGFLISRTIWDDLHHQRFSIRGFYERRVRRLFPGLTVALLSTWLVGLATLSWDELARLGKHVFASSIFGLNFFLWNESGYFDVAGERKPLLHLWSLSIEEQFYLLWPLILVMVSGSRARLVRTLAVLAALSLCASVVFVASGEKVVAFYNPIGRIWELMLGSALGYICTFCPQLVGRFRFTAPLGLILIGGSYLLFSDQTPFPGLLALIPTVGAGLILISSPTTARNKSLLQNRVMIGIGVISYPLYL